MVIFNPKSSGWVIDIDCIINFVRLNNKRYMFFYGILNYDDSLIFNIFSSPISIQ